MNKIDRFCEAIMWFEGWNTSSRSYRNNNPGNLRWSKFQNGTEDGYSKFDRFNLGWYALTYDVQCKALGKTSTRLTPESTLIEFFEVFAPHRDNNNPHHYATVACRRANLNPAMQLKDLL